MKIKNCKSVSLGFTLIELLVVIAIIALLLAVALPGLTIAKERCKRVVCLSNIHQFMLGIQIYAEQNEYQLPTPGIRSTFELCVSDYEIFTDAIGDDKAMFCPGLGEPFNRKSFRVSSYFPAHENRFYIGYNYLGGRKDAPWLLAGQATSEWESPLLSSCPVTMPVVTEVNIWSPFFDKTVAPHGNKGAFRLGGDYMNTGLQGISSGSLGAAGGNTGFIDGSGHWKKIDEKNIYRVKVGCNDSDWFSTW